MQPVCATTWQMTPLKQPSPHACGTSCCKQTAAWCDIIRWLISSVVNRCCVLVLVMQQLPHALYGKQCTGACHSVKMWCVAGRSVSNSLQIVLRKFWISNSWWDCCCVSSLFLLFECCANNQKSFVPCFARSCAPVWQRVEHMLTGCCCNQNGSSQFVSASRLAFLHMS